MSGFLGSLIGTLVSAVTSVTDPLFRYVTLLLNGDGTNGAQNNTFLDSSSNNFAITRTGTPTQGTFSPFSQTGWSSYSSGSANCVSVASNAAFAFGTADFIVEGFYNLNALATTGGVSNTLFLYDMRNNSGTTVAGTLRLDTSTFALVYEVAGTVRITGTTPLVVGTWYYVCVSRVSGVTRMFLNATQQGSNYTDSNSYVTCPVFIGRDNDSNNNRYMNGYVSNFQIRTGVGVSSVTVPTTQLTASTGTVLLTCQSNRFVDNGTANGGTGFPITITGTPSIQAFSPFAPAIAYSPSVVGGSGYFNATSDYLSFPYNTSLQLPADFTIEFYVYNIAKVTSFPCIFSNFTTYTTNGGLSFFANHASGTANKYTIAFNGSFPAITSTASISYNAWQHVALVRSGSVITMYIDGVASGTLTSSVTVTGNAVSWWLGISAYDGASVSYLNAYLSNFRVVKGTAVYTANFTPPTAPLTAIAGTSFLANFTNAGIADATAKNDLVTVGSAQVAAGSVSTSATGVISTTTIVVSSATGIALGQLVTGTGIGTGAVVTGISGTTITLSVANFGTIATSVTFTNPVKFGTGAMSFNGSGSFLNGGSSQLSAFGTGPYTVEFWVNPILIAATHIYYRMSATGGFQIYYDSTSGVGISAIGSAGFLFGGALTVNTWQHVAVCRNSTATNDTRMSVNGVIKATGTDATNWTITGPMCIGSNVSGTAFNGYLDDLRVTKAARYTTAFTPPTQAFPVQ